MIEDRLSRRKERFLQLVEDSVFGPRDSPYRRLLQNAGLGMQEVRALVESRSLEDALAALLEAGVYLSYDEFKGRRPAVRDGRSFHFREEDFDNPRTAPSFEVSSGASRSPGTRTMFDFDYLTMEAVSRAVFLDAFDILGAPSVLWYPILPGNAGIMNVFRQAKVGTPRIRWFSQVDARSIRPALKDRAGTAFIIGAARLFSRKLPKPEFVDLGEAEKVARAVAWEIEHHGRCSVWTYVNSAVRICAAALEEGLSLEGAVFFVSGEPLTEPKRRQIESTGADAVPYFAFVEGGIAACGCARPEMSDDMHLLGDRMALITRPRFLQSSGETVESLLFTSLQPEAPKILLNVETGDCGEVRSLRCGCPLGLRGFNTVLSSVKSYEKFTSEGMSFSVGDMVRLVDDVLPAKFGGNSADFQVLERPDDRGLTTIDILVSPRLGAVDEKELLDTVRQELALGKPSNRLMAEMWSRSGTMCVRREEPLPTARGKILPFQQEIGRETDRVLEPQPPQEGS
jgi:hypothetical protein